MFVASELCVCPRAFGKVQITTCDEWNAQPPDDFQDIALNGRVNNFVSTKDCLFPFNVCEQVYCNEGRIFEYVFSLEAAAGRYCILVHRN